ncbi:MAG: autotransporter-associated beta strand repeat-containing protein, partial [Kiritimatiellia bacterium]|nr:autotransporter-associated beta strand repeat-containing protein [Kiritimatiellia bacterium]
MRPKNQIALAAGVLCAAVLHVGAFETINWLSSVADGYYNDPASWTGGILPTNGNTGRFTGNQDYVVRFPEGGLVENSVTQVDNLSSGRSVTFDTRGTWWLKAGCDAWPNDYTAFKMCANASHYFNVEGVIKTGSALDYPVMEMSNALFRVQYHSTGMTNVLEEGFLNLYNPGGINRSAHSLVTGSYAPANSLILFKTNSMFRANTIRMRGHPAALHRMRFEGGTHEVYNGFRVTEEYASIGTTCALEVTGGDLAIRSGDLVIGRSRFAHGRLELSGPAAVSVRETVLTSYSATNSTGHITMCDTSRLTVGGNVRLSASRSAFGTLALTNAASLVAGQTMLVAEAAASTATVEVASQALLSVTGQVTVAAAADALGALTLRDQAVGFLGNKLVIGNNGGDGSVTVADDASLTVAGTAVVVAGDSGTTSRGLLELAAVPFDACAVRGGVGAQCRGGTGWAEVRMDGAMWRVGPVPADGVLMQDLDLAQLGAGGLTLDTAGADVAINQAFSEAPGADAALVKTGDGVLTMANSEHARTVLAQGTLLAAETAAACGRNLAVSNNATLSLLGTAETLTAGDLTLGSGAGHALLSLDAGDCLIVTGALSVAGCVMDFGGADSNDVYTLLRSTGAISPDVLTKFSIANPAAGKGYAFAIVADGGEETIRLTVSAYTITDAAWDGSESADWNTADNWTPSGVPTYGTRATFGAAAAQKAVTLSAPGLTTFLEFDSAAGYTLGGAQPLTLPAGTVENKLGGHEIALPLTLSGETALPTAAAATTTVSGPVSANLLTRVAKSGSGTVVVSGDNAGFQGAWQTGGGRLTFASAAAWGSANAAADAVTVGAGTLRQSGTPASVSKGVTVATGDNLKAALFDTAADLAVSGPLATQSGIFCKHGAGTLAWDIGSSVAKLSSGNGSAGVNVSPTGLISLPETGDAPASATGLAGFNVLEGTLSMRGNGPGVSIVNQNHVGMIGGRIATCLADPTLELDNLRMDQGGSGLHLLIGNEILSDSVARSPTLRLVNNALLNCNTVKFGVNSAAAITPTLVMSNATMNVSFLTSVGGNTQISPVLRLTDNSSLSSAGDSINSGGIYFYRQIDMLVSGGSTVSQTAVGGAFRFYDARSEGTIRFEQGSTLRFSRFLGFNYLTESGLNLTFDDATVEPLFSGVSLSTRADKQSFLIEDGGLTVRTAAGIRHVFHFPLTGAGALTKTGAGELVFGEGLNYTPSLTNLTGLATGDYTGGTAVQEGTLSVSNGTIRADAAVRVAAGAKLNLSAGEVTLGEVSGSGTVTNGTLLAGYRCRVAPAGADRLTLADVTLPAGFTVTFDAEAGSELASGQKVAVADLAGATVPNLGKWSAQHVGEKLSARFTLEGAT